jgi:hypothetical protein
MSHPAPEIKHRYSIRDYILTLDPVKDHQQICFLSSCYDFPWDFTRSLELALQGRKSRRSWVVKGSGFTTLNFAPLV